MRLTYDEIIQRAREYVRRCEISPDEKDPDERRKMIQRAQWEHFVAFCYEDPDELEQIIADYREEMQRQRREAKKKPKDPPKPKGRPRKHPRPETDADAGKAADPAEKGNEDKGKDADCGAVCGAVDAKRMECGAELVRLSNYIQAQLATSPYWGGNQSMKAIFLLKQNRTGRGMREKIEQQIDADVSINVSFGGGIDDPFG